MSTFCPPSSAHQYTHTLIYAKYKAIPQRIITLEWHLRWRQARGNQDKSAHKHSGRQAAGACREMKYTDVRSLQFERDSEWVIRELEEKHSGRGKKSSNKAQQLRALQLSQTEGMVYSWARVRGRGCCSRRRWMCFICLTTKHKGEGFKGPIKPNVQIFT